MVAEKLHAIAFHGIRNGGMKDFLDLLIILERETLDKNILSKAVAATFARRGSDISKPLVGLSDEFANDESKQVMWNMFLKRNKLPEKTLPAVINVLRQKLQPILDAAVIA